MVDLILLKEHIGLDTSDTSEDQILNQYMLASAAAIDQELGYPSTDMEDINSEYYAEGIPATITQAQLILAASFYNNGRENEVFGSRVTELPFGVKMLVSPYKMDFIGGVL